MFILLDYDGTLVPIREEPSLARIEPSRKRFIEELSRKLNVAIVTGRSEESFREVFGSVPDSLYLLTSHGGVIQKGNSTIYRFNANMPDLSPLKEELKRFKGVFVEEKHGGFALHFRKNPQAEEELREVFLEFTRRTNPQRIIFGKKVMEAIYGHFDKGKGITKLIEILGQGREELLYIGDDRTDLIAFDAVKKLGGKTIFVGDSAEGKQADRVLRSVEEVYDLLRSLEKVEDKDQVIL